MKTYPDNTNILPNDFKFWEYKITVPDEETKKEMMDAFHHIYNSSIDTSYVLVNQLAHEYINGENISIDSQEEITIDKAQYQKLLKYKEKYLEWDESHWK